MSRQQFSQHQTYIKLVVLNEHTLGYIFPQLPNYVQVLHASILKGAPFELWPSRKHIGSQDTVRLASRKDFEAFNQNLEQYSSTGEYEFVPDDPNYKYNSQEFKCNI